MSVMRSCSATMQAKVCFSFRERCLSEARVRCAEADEKRPARKLRLHPHSKKSGKRFLRRRHSTNNTGFWLWLLRTNTALSPLAAMLRYRELLKVEDIFRTTKSILDTRPIYHQTDAAIRGHVFCSFLALVLRKGLEDRLVAARLRSEWGALLMDLDRL